jgi:hypothetical protein
MRRVRSALALSLLGLTIALAANSGSTQWLHFGGGPWIAQHAQLFRADGLSRYHLRLWEGPSPATVVGVHHERTIVRHTIDKSWEASEAFLRDQLCPSCGTTDLLTEQSAIQGGDAEWRGWANDAHATVIRQPR